MEKQTADKIAFYNLHRSSPTRFFRIVSTKRSYFSDTSQNGSEKYIVITVDKSRQCMLPYFSTRLFRNFTLGISFPLNLASSSSSSPLPPLKKRKFAIINQKSRIKMLKRNIHLSLSFKNKGNKHFPKLLTSKLSLFPSLQ